MLRGAAFPAYAGRAPSPPGDLRGERETQNSKTPRSGGHAYRQGAGGNRLLQSDPPSSAGALQAPFGPHRRRAPESLRSGLIGGQIVRRKQTDAERAKKRSERNLLSYYRHKEKRLEQRRQYRIEARAARREYSKQWRKKNPDLMIAQRWRKRVRRMGFRDVDGLLDLLLSAKVCHWCKKKWKVVGKPTIDHVIPVSAGGLSIISNVVASCLSCNMRKQDKLFHPVTGQGILL
jgi:hypothetical protein